VAERWLEQLEETLAESELATAIVTVAAVAGRELESTLDPAELRAATRRALFVLAAGGDPDRGLDLNGPAVSRLAEELESPETRRALEAGLAALRADAVGLPHVTEASQALLDAPELAWRAFACALLAEELADET
jgi:hypothetical protein